MALVIACAVVFAAGVAFCAYSQLRKEKFPNLLAERFGQGAVFEYEGVQFTSIAPAQVSCGEVFVLEVHLQNCWSAPRSFAWMPDRTRW